MPLRSCNTVIRPLGGSADPSSNHHGPVAPTLSEGSYTSVGGDWSIVHTSNLLQIKLNLLIT